MRIKYPGFYEHSSPSSVGCHEAGDNMMKSASYSADVLKITNQFLSAATVLRVL